MRPIPEERVQLEAATLEDAWAGLKLIAWLAVGLVVEAFVLAVVIIRLLS